MDNRIFQHVLAWECDSDILAWYERVPSSANVADALSRGDVSNLDPSLETTVNVTGVLKNLFESCPRETISPRVKQGACVCVCVRMFESASSHELQTSEEQGHSPEGIGLCL